jgi:hypothetical protein
MYTNPDHCWRGMLVQGEVSMPTPTAAALRRRLVDELRTAGAITTDAVAQAMLAVPREAFAPAGADSAEVYASHGIVVTKRGPEDSLVVKRSAPVRPARLRRLGGTAPRGTSCRPGLQTQPLQPQLLRTGQRAG